MEDAQLDARAHHLEAHLRGVGVGRRDALDLELVRAGLATMRVLEEAIVRMTAETSDPAIGQINGMVRATMRDHRGNYQQDYLAHLSTLQAVAALLG